MRRVGTVSSGFVLSLFLTRGVQHWESVSAPLCMELLHEHDGHSGVLVHFTWHQGLALATGVYGYQFKMHSESSHPLSQA